MTMVDSPRTAESIAEVNGIEINFDTIGNPADIPILMIHGLGAQLISWDDEFCEQIAARGHYLIRFDNRDAGHSTHFTDVGMPDLVAYMAAWMSGNKLEAPYYLSDMAADAVGLLDHLGIKSANILGVSMGGMIAQKLVIDYPDRVRTLTSIMSTTGRPELDPPTPEAITLLTSPSASDLAAYIEQQLASARVLNGPKYPVDEARIRRRAPLLWNRGLSPEGTARQLVAVVSSEGRHEALQKVTVPTLVIHGDADPLVPLAGGLDTAESVPNAKLHIMQGVGHAIPMQIWDEIIEIITSHFR